MFISERQKVHVQQLHLFLYSFPFSCVLDKYPMRNLNAGHHFSAMKGRRVGALRWQFLMASPLYHARQ